MGSEEERNGRKYVEGHEKSHKDMRDLKKREARKRDQENRDTLQEARERETG